MAAGILNPQTTMLDSTLEQITNAMHVACRHVDRTRGACDQCSKEQGSVDSPRVLERPESTEQARIITERYAGKVVASFAPLMLKSPQLRLVEMACILSIVAAYRLN